MGFIEYMHVVAQCIMKNAIWIFVYFIQNLKLMIGCKLTDDS